MFTNKNLLKYSLLFVLSFMLSGLCYGQDYQRLKPKEPKQQTPTHKPIEREAALDSCVRDEGSDVLATKTLGITIAGPHTNLSVSELKHQRGVCIQGISLEKDQKQTLVNELSENYINSPLTCSLISDIKRDIVLYYRKINRPLVAVHVPEQNISNGVLVLVVLESKLGKIDVKGNKHFSEERYKEYIQVDQGDLIFSDTLVSDLHWINRNPFRSSYAVYKKGAYPETTDIDLVTTDKFPVRVYVGADNTGFDDTEYERLFAGVNWGDAFGLDQVLSFQFTASPDFRKFLAYSGHWTIPLPWRNLIDIFGGYSETKAHLSDNELKTEGQATQVSFRYGIPMPVAKNFFSEIRFGFDFKRMNNNVVFGGENISKRSINEWQWMALYEMTIPNDFVTSYIEGAVFCQPGQMLSNMTNAEYTLLRRGAKNHYVYGRIGLEQIYHYIPLIPWDFTMSFKLKAQAASGALLPSEQVGLGGFYSVRGYDERAINVDNALVTNFELRAPSFSPTTTGVDNLVIFAFTDWGLGANHFRPSFQAKTLNLLSIGPGCRYAISDYVQVVFNWGWQVLKIPESKNGNRANFSAVVSY